MVVVEPETGGDAEEEKKKLKNLQRKNGFYERERRGEEGRGHVARAVCIRRTTGLALTAAVA